jgi:SEL1 protein
VLSALATSETAASYTTTASARGPITAALRWIKQRSKWRSKSNRRAGDHFAGISGDEGQALKVVDLLEHAIELGSVDALYTLGEISLVSLIQPS